MSDVRHCDGPGCEVSAPHGDGPASYKEIPLEHFITLERRSLLYPDLHFHSQECLSKWTAKETTRSASH
jgi:hypothetical protein